MKDINKKTAFDKRWEEAFLEAEMTPSESVWDKIDASLSKEEAGYFKRKAFLFKLLAAASIAFALGTGIFSLNYYLAPTNRPNMAQSDEPTAKDSSDGIAQTLKPDALMETNTSSSEARERASAKTEDDNLPVGSKADSNGLIAAFEPTSADGSADTSDDFALNATIVDGNSELVMEGTDTREPLELLTSLDALSPLGVHSNVEDEALYEPDHIYLIPFMPRGASKIKKNSTEGVLMASLDFSAGQFDPNFQQSTPAFASPNAFMTSGSRTELASFDATNKNFLLMRSRGQETKPELTYSYGANIGFKISPRFLLQSGLAYRKANTTTYTTSYIENAGSNSRVPFVASYDYQLSGLSKVSDMERTGLDNQYEFAAIPVRVGYVILNTKISVTVLAGVSSEFFLNNKIQGNSQFLQSLSNGNGENSNFKSVHFNGSVGTMLGYTFADNYMLTLEPGYRMALNSFTKDSFYLESYPSSFMLSFGVAYNFR
jgi:hypothetical protein